MTTPSLSKRPSPPKPGFFQSIIGAAGREPSVPPTQSKRQAVTLRRQLLTTILPIVLVPLTIAGVSSWSITYQRAARQAELRLRNDGLLTAKITDLVLEDALSYPLIVATNPSVINAARAGTKQVEAAGLHLLPSDRVDSRFTATKLLATNPVLNDYLNSLTQIGKLENLFFTERNGFNIAYSSPTSNLVQSDQKWWRKAKKAGTSGSFVGETGLDKSTSSIGVELIAPIADPASGDFLGVVKGVISTANFAKELASALEYAGFEVSSSKKLQIVNLEHKDIVVTITTGGSSDTQQLQGGEAVWQRAAELFAEFRTKGIDVKNPPLTTDKLQVLTTTFTHNGRQYALTQVPLTNWMAVSSIDLAEIRRPGNELALIFTVIFLILGAVAATIVQLLGRRLSAPLSDLTSTAEQVALGNLDVYAQARGTSETQTLAQSFNNLVTRVKTLLAEKEEATIQQVQVAAQKEIAHQQTENAEQQRLAKEQLQKRALELLIEVEPISQGDLTIRASVTADEIGTIADSYNATVGSLRKIVTQVQAAALLVVATTGNGEGAVQELSAEALRQEQEIAAALERIQQMSKSNSAIAISAEQAKAAVKQTNQTVEAGNAAMNRTVDGIVAIRDTVAQTSVKVKHLGESSQKISKVVKLIGRFAAQTNLLALKASIEAARAGEEGRGFAVLADEVRALAGQSAQATAEIEGLVVAIQTETNELVAAMALGTEQVATGTILVDETRQSLNNIAAASVDISALVEEITSAAGAQFLDSKSVTQTMSDIAAIASSTSTEAITVSASFKELLAVATELQTSVGQFKVS